MADETPPDKPLDQTGIDALADELLKMGSFGDVSGSQPAAAAQPPLTPDLAELEALLKQATFDDASTSVAAAKNAVDDITSQIFAEAEAAEKAERQAAARGGGQSMVGLGIQMPVQSNAPLPATMPFDLQSFQQTI